MRGECSLLCYFGLIPPLYLWGEVERESRVVWGCPNSFDLNTNNNRLEVKTALIRKFERKHEKYPTYYYDGCEFRRNPKQHRESSSGFVVCLDFKSSDYSDEPRCFIIPTKELRGLSGVIKISAKPKRKPKYWEYEDKWDLIAKV